MSRVSCLGSLVVLLAVASAAAAQTPRSKPPEGTKVYANLEYVPGGHERHRLDLFIPVKADGPLPVIVWIHGGAWMAGSKGRWQPGPTVRRRGLRGGLHQLPAQPARPVPGSDRGLQGGDPLVEGQREDVQPRPGTHRRLGCIGWRPSGRAPGHLRRRRRSREQGRTTRINRVACRRWWTSSARPTSCKWMPTPCPAHG